MPDNAEARRSVAGIVTPNSAKDEDWRREVAGVYSFADATSFPELNALTTNELNALSTSELNGLLLPVSSGTGPVFSSLTSSCFSPLGVPMILARF